MSGKQSKIHSNYTEASPEPHNLQYKYQSILSSRKYPEINPATELAKVQCHCGLIRLSKKCGTYAFVSYDNQYTGNHKIHHTSEISSLRQKKERQFRIGIFGFTLYLNKYFNHPFERA